MGAQNIARIVVVLGLVVGVTVLMYAEMGLPGGPPGIGPVGTPTFVNPFDAIPTVLSTYSFLPANASHGAIVPAWETTELTGCTVLWQCVWDPNGTDGAVSYATIHFRPFGFANFTQPTKTRITIDLAGSNLFGQVLTQYSVDFVCRTRNSVDPLEIANPGAYQWNGTAYNSIAVSSNHVTCPIGAFKQVSSRSGNVSGDTSGRDFVLTTDLDQFQPFGVDLGDVPVIDISTFRFTGIYRPTTGPGCVGGDFFSNLGCQFGAIWDSVGKFFQLIVNLIVYVGSWIIAVGVVASQVFLSLAWFLAIPGAPLPVQLLIAAAIIGMSVLLLVEFARIVRGVGT